MNADDHKMLQQVYGSSEVPANILVEYETVQGRAHKRTSGTLSPEATALLLRISDLRERIESLEEDRDRPTIKGRRPKGALKEPAMTG